MDTRLFPVRFAGIVLSLVFLTGAQYETTNFTVDNAPTLELAKEFGETAERCRNELAVRWLGKTLPDWAEKCPIRVAVGENLGAGGATTFIFDNGEVYGWEMNIQGSAQRILDSVIPHEITHTVFATYFRQPVPRWLDEGAATTVECSAEKESYRRMLRHFLRDDVKKCLPFNRMVAATDYPSDPMPFYAQGFSVTEFLIHLGKQRAGDIGGLHGERLLVRFAETGMRTGDWNAALRQHYDIDNLGELQQNHWLAWLKEPATVLLVAPPMQSVYNRVNVSFPITMDDIPPLP
ncbi:MAG: hypothetical protein LBN39_09550 [Planctomycetaceae bacterium]|jgi:hypothetical protein|nr:hypothetical protein [Planctomycetaceae bacterium]